MAQWVGHRPAKQKVTGSIPSQGTYLGCGYGPRWGIHGRQPIDVSLSFSPSLPLFLKINK